MTVLDPTPEAPASCCAEQVIGDFRDYQTVVDFGIKKNVITIEIEDVNLSALEYLATQNIEIYPSPAALNIIQDKGKQKLFYQQHNFPTAPFFLTQTKEDILKLILQGKINYPFVQKLRKAGYDGRGVQIIRNQEDLDRLFESPSLVEVKISIHREIAILAARNKQHEVTTYDPVEMIFHPEANLLLYQRCPASVSDLMANEAKKIAADLIAKLDVVGLLAVEFFIDESGTLMINEVAPRPHNSGHHTIEACQTSQFHQHWRCILGLPLGSTISNGYSVLLNVLGEPGLRTGT